MADLSAIRDYTEQILDIKSGDVFIDSTYEDQIIQKGYEKTATRYDWPDHLKRDADVIIANVDRYTLPSDFRKFRFLFSRGSEKEETEFNNIPFQRLAYGVARDSSEYILTEIPQTASTPFTLSNSETAGSAVVIELDTISGLTAGEDIWFDNGTSSEFTVIQSVDTTNTTITAKIANDHDSGKILYKLSEINYFQYYKSVATLSASDTPELPNPLHFTIAHYAAFLYFQKKQDTAESDKNFAIWQNELRDYWLAYDTSSSGHVGQFSV